MSASGPFRPVRHALCLLAAFQDAVTRITFVVAIIASAYLTLVLAWEVIARYALNTPSGWGPDTAAISFALITFCAAPMLAWKGGHANMNMVVKALPLNIAIWLQRFTWLLACAACLIAAWFGLIELERVFAGNVMMIAVTPIPKWWLMLAIVYALSNMGFYFLRHFLCTWFEAAKQTTIETA
ncbi:MAG: C4-dicarboxylate ABC transporter permease [Pusillimonas sp.]|nr:C4-dicarboxylate ABC transporter permease [Pusillimonas sp.]MBC41390.1 C4-dicarboxylate ABC transporter permease [Pusillimonas sp.]HCP79942.1 C4-dicarboxylate ABC transporter permease [Pusillimonas sp.]|tara:strand:+ start:29379 stop:29927 length:549 start_codon:yes stop_codon:yes gene_type:complete